jgi:hypothetical protein
MTELNLGGIRLALPAGWSDITDDEADSGQPFTLAKAQDSAMFRVSADFDHGGSFVRTWYLSDGTNLVLVTFLAELSLTEGELESADAIVASMRFVPQERER